MVNTIPSASFYLSYRIAHPKILFYITKAHIILVVINPEFGDDNPGAASDSVHASRLQ